MDENNELMRFWRKDGAMMVCINLRTWEMTFGPEYTPDDAAKTFWISVLKFGPMLTRLVLNGRVNFDLPV
jgi:hypothetical protein